MEILDNTYQERQEKQARHDINNKVKGVFSILLTKWNQMILMNSRKCEKVQNVAYKFTKWFMFDILYSYTLELENLSCKNTNHEVSSEYIQWLSREWFLHIRTTISTSCKKKNPITFMENDKNHLTL